MMAYTKLEQVCLATLALLLMLVLVSTAGAQGPVVAAGEDPVALAVPPAYEILNLHLDLPTGARIDYLRLWYYDRSATTNSTAWITTYDGMGGFTDLIGVSSVGSSGYGYSISAYVGHIVDNASAAYVLNWRANSLGRSTQLCGLRVAYREPLDGGSWSNFRYVTAAGSTLTPRASGLRWDTDGSGGCRFLNYGMFLPVVIG